MSWKCHHGYPSSYNFLTMPHGSFSSLPSINTGVTVLLIQIIVWLFALTIVARNILLA